MNVLNGVGIKKRGGPFSGGCVSKNDEFCISNEEFCIKNEELCIQLMNFAAWSPDGVYIATSHGYKDPQVRFPLEFPLVLF